MEENSIILLKQKKYNLIIPRSIINIVDIQLLTYFCFLYLISEPIFPPFGHWKNMPRNKIRLGDYGS